MSTPITANYVPDGDDWKVSVTRADRTLTGSAPGLIAARDTADQLVEKLAPSEDDATVVHLMEGDAVAFSTAYLYARHGGHAQAPAEDVATPAVDSTEAADSTERNDAIPDTDQPGAEISEAKRSGIAESAVTGAGREADPLWREAVAERERPTSGPAADDTGSARPRSVVVTVGRYIQSAPTEIGSASGWEDTSRAGKRMPAEDSAPPAHA